MNESQYNETIPPIPAPLPLGRIEGVRTPVIVADCLNRHAVAPTSKSQWHLVQSEQPAGSDHPVEEKDTAQQVEALLRACLDVVLSHMQKVRSFKLSAETKAKLEELITAVERSS
jgi:hypothetical protein